jgi:phosphoglycolate phosphatase-like HAD superfamily hydrolase
MPDVLLTDIDGTLVDNNALHAEAWRRTFEHFGIQVGFDGAWRQIGKGGDKVIALFVPEADQERLEKPIKDFRKEIFHRDYMPRTVALSQASDGSLWHEQASFRGGAVEDSFCPCRRRSKMA